MCGLGRQMVKAGNRNPAGWNNSIQNKITSSEPDDMFCHPGVESTTIANTP